MAQMYDNGIGKNSVAYLGNDKRGVSYLGNNFAGYYSMPQKQERERDRNVPKKPEGVPGIDLPDIGDILDNVDGILEKQPNPKDYRQPGGQ